MTTGQHHLGWIPDRPDPRDVPYSELRPYRFLRIIGRSSEADLRPTGLLPAVYNQSSLGSCGLNAGAAQAWFTEAKEGHPVQLSRLAWYYDIRLGYGKVYEDTGCQIRDLYLSLKRTGCTREELWPYDLAHWQERPPLHALHEGFHRRLDLAYFRLATLSDVLDCVSQGFPVAFGIVLFEAFEHMGPDAVAPVPCDGDPMLGGHAMLIVGYSMTKRAVLVRNSWGPEWGLGGYCWIPFDYLTAWAWDFWTLRKIAR